MEKICVALFWDPLQHHDWLTNNTLMYKGQKIRKTMDCYFERGGTDFYIFKKENKKGWGFYGKTTVVRKVIKRVHDKQQNVYKRPLWELAENDYNNEYNDINQIIKIYHDSVSVHPTYLSKLDLFAILNFDPRLQSMSSGIIPFTNLNL